MMDNLGVNQKDLERRIPSFLIDVGKAQATVSMDYIRKVAEYEPEQVSQ